MATSSAMKSSLVLLLLLSAVAASHAHEVSCKNACKDPIWLNGNMVSPGKSIDLNLSVEVFSIIVFDTDGAKHFGTYKCPERVRELEFRYNEATGFLEVQITGVLLLLGEILDPLLGFVTRSIQCRLRF